MIGGAILISDRPFKRGDLIETDMGWATVEEVGLRSTRLRNLDDAVVIIPNAQLTDKSIINWQRRRMRKVLLDISVTYDTPRATLDELVSRIKAVYLAQPTADQATGYVGLKQFGESSIDIELWGYFYVSDYQSQVEARHQLMADIIDLADEIGVSFAFPTRTVHLPVDHAEHLAMARKFVAAS